MAGLVPGEVDEALVLTSLPLDRSPGRSVRDRVLATRAAAGVRTRMRERWGPRRAGPQGGSSLTFRSPNLATVLNVLDDERRQILELDDEPQVLGALEELRTALVVFMAELDSETPRVVRRLRRRGWTFQDIATAGDVPVTRVAQLARATLSSTRHAEPPTSR